MARLAMRGSVVVWQQEGRGIDEHSLLPGLAHDGDELMVISIADILGAFGVGFAAVIAADAWSWIKRLVVVIRD